MTLLLATHNRKKAQELLRLIRIPSIRFLALNQFPQIPQVVEDGSTFRANAVKKAVETSRHTILPVLAEDSGLEVKALSGRPGVYSARFAGPQQNDKKNIDKLLRLMARTPASRRKGRFVCCIALAVGGRMIRTFQASSPGYISFKAAGRTGFGYDPVFIPKGFKKTFAQLGPRQKDKLSHRSRAVVKLRIWFRKGL